MQQQVKRSDSQSARVNLAQVIDLIETSSDFMAGAMMAFDALDKGTCTPLIRICSESMDYLERARDLLAADLAGVRE